MRLSIFFATKGFQKYIFKRGMSSLKLAIASLGASAFFVAFAEHSLSCVPEGPFFIDSSKVPSQYTPLLSTNRAIGQMEENVKERMRVYDDSISVIISSIDVRDAAKESRLELLNMESDVARHKMLDSVKTGAEQEIREAYAKFDATVAVFCRKHGIGPLFGTASNTIVYGADGRADKTGDFVRFMETNHENQL